MAIIISCFDTTHEHDSQPASHPATHPATQPPHDGKGHASAYHRVARIGV